MLGIDFAKAPAGLTGIAGMEFMDYQSADFYNELRAMFAKLITVDDGKHVLSDDDKDLQAISDVIFKATGIRTKIHAEPAVGNAAIDAGFMSPSNLMNIKGIDNWLAAKDTNIGRAFKSLKTDVLKGWVDTSTGRVGGDFSKFTIDMYINQYVNDFIKGNVLLRYKVDMADAISTIVIHECGHAFTGFLFINRTYMDTMLSLHAVRLIENNNVYGKERFNIVKETMSLLECDGVPKQEELDKMSGSDISIVFNKASIARDYRRTLSLGTADRGSEIYADLYAIRFGAPKVMVAALASLPDISAIYNSLILFGTAVSISAALMAMPVYLAIAAISTVTLIMGKYNTMLNPNDTYDSTYRRLKAILRDQVVRLNEDKRLDKREATRLLKETKDMEKIIDENKPYLEGTAVQRFLAWVYNGADFKAQEFEHYSEELLGHTLSLYKNAF